MRRRTPEGCSSRVEVAVTQCDCEGCDEVEKCHLEERGQRRCYFAAMLLALAAEAGAPCEASGALTAPRPAAAVIAYDVPASVSKLNCPLVWSFEIAMVLPATVVTLAPPSKGDAKLHTPPTVDSTTMFEAAPLSYSAETRNPPIPAAKSQSTFGTVCGVESWPI